MDAWQKMLQGNEDILLVNENDIELGTINKVLAHQGAGKLHRAITVVLRNQRGEWLLTQRSTKKPLWPLWWDAACSTHQWPGESDVEASARRLPFELGINAEDLAFAFADRYSAVYSPEWSENEWNHIVTGILERDPQPNPDEVAAFRWATTAEIAAELENPNHRFVPWFVKLFERMA